MQTNHLSTDARAAFADELRRVVGSEDPAPVNGDEFMAGIRELFGQMKPRTAEEMRAMHFETQIAPRLGDFGFETRYRQMDILSGRDPRCREQESVLARVESKFTNAGAIVALVGPRGTGKTSIAAQLAANRLWEDWRIALAGERKGVPCRITSYRKLGALVARLKAYYGDFGSVQSEQMHATLEHLCAVECLVIDELFEVPDDSKHKDRLLTDILDRRYAARRDTLLISNQTRDEFVSNLVPSIGSRLLEHGGVIRCEWQSFRDKPAL